MYMAVSLDEPLIAVLGSFYI